MSLCQLSRVLVVSAFKTYKMADLRTKIRFENFSYSTMFGGTKFPGIRIERLDKRISGDRARSAANAPMGKRRNHKQSVSHDQLSFSG